MMRLGLALAALLLCLCACSSGRHSIEDACRTAYLDGYHRGASDAMNAVARQAETARKTALQNVRPKLLWGALAAALMTLLGDKLAEAIRLYLAESFKLEPDRQAKLATLLFWIAAVSAVAILYGRHGFAPLPSELLLLGTAAWSLHTGYIPALLSADKPSRSLALSKIKTLLFLVLVVAAVFELLSTNSPIAFKP